MSVKIFIDATEDEFEFIEAVNELSNQCGALVEALVPDPDILQNIRMKRIKALQQKAIKCYEDCIEYQCKAEESNSEVVSAPLKMLYKMEKALKHYFRTLSVAQSLAFSQSFFLNYMKNKGHFHLYVFVRNVCTTVEYLGAMIINRVGDGSVDITDPGENWVHVYEKLKAQDLHEPLTDEDMEVAIPPTGREEPLNELPLSSFEMDYLNRKRNDIVHHCPLFVPETDPDVLPEELVNNRIMTKKDLRSLCEYASRLHLHTTMMFIDFVSSYLKSMLEGFIEMVYVEQ